MPGILLGNGIVKANRVLAFAPTLLTATIAQADQDAIVLTFDQNISSTVTPSASAFTISGGRTASSVSISGANVTVTASSVFIYNETVTIGYTQPLINALVGVVGGIKVESFSAHAVTNNISYPADFDDGTTVAWYSPKRTGGETITARGLAWWDMMVGSSTYGPVLNSGTTVSKEVYLIVTCQTNYFYTGCKAGDLFVGHAVAATINASNTVRKVLGNHIVQYDSSKAPVNQVFNGTSHGMATPTITFAKPAMIYLLVKQITWTNSDYLIDGLASESINILQYDNTPELAARGNTLSTHNANLPVGNWGIVRALFKGVGSTFQIDDTAVITWNCGSAGNPGGICLGSRGYAASNWANIEVAEVVARSVDESASANTNIYNYLVARKAQL